MSTALATAGTAPEAIMERVIAVGDLKQLTPTERTQYYTAVCRSVGLNPLTRPFEYITLNNKLTLYARKDCTDQLRQIHNVSIISLEETEREGVYCITAKAQNAAGRIDMAKGAVSLSSLKGEALANAMMKAETKAKRRVTLSICGLGFLDETEVDAIPASRPGIRPEMTPAEVLAAAFARYEVTEKMLTDYLKHSLAEVLDDEMATLRGIYVKVANGEEWNSVINPQTPDAEVVAGEPTTAEQLQIRAAELVTALADAGYKGNIKLLVEAEGGKRDLTKVPAERLPALIARLESEISGLRAQVN